jgi:hypothetical protein
MPDNLDWLLAPVAANWCKYESLKDGTLDLLDIAIMNDALAVKAENDARARKAAERK